MHASAMSEWRLCDEDDIYYGQQRQNVGAERQQYDYLGKFCVGKLGIGFNKSRKSKT